MATPKKSLSYYLRAAEQYEGFLAIWFQGRGAPKPIRWQLTTNCLNDVMARRAKYWYGETLFDVLQKFVEHSDMDNLINEGPPSKTDAN